MSEAALYEHKAHESAQESSSVAMSDVSTPTSVGHVETMKKATQLPEDLPHHDALIVGAGWAGIWLLHRLRQKRFCVKLFEAHEDVGGVWLYTRYPGCRNETVSWCELPILL